MDTYKHSTQLTKNFGEINHWADIVFLCVCIINSKTIMRGINDLLDERFVNNGSHTDLNVLKKWGILQFFFRRLLEKQHGKKCEMFTLAQDINRICLWSSISADHCSPIRMFILVYKSLLNGFIGLSFRCLVCGCLCIHRSSYWISFCNIRTVLLYLFIHLHSV